MNEEAKLITETKLTPHASVDKGRWIGYMVQMQVESIEKSGDRFDSLFQQFDKYVEVLNDKSTGAVKKIDVELALKKDKLYAFVKILVQPRKQTNIHLIKLRNDSMTLLGYDPKIMIQNVLDPLKKQLKDII